jgi:hypothetical protein
VAKVIYDAKDGKSSKTYDALDWLAQLVVHISDYLSLRIIDKMGLDNHKKEFYKLY